MSSVKIIAKLVRDKIPDIIKQTGENVYYLRLDKERYKKEIKAKLLEEITELFYALDKNDNANMLEEVADIYEVLEAIVSTYSSDNSLENIAKIKSEKRITAGSFREKKFLKSINKDIDIEDGIYSSTFLIPDESHKLIMTIKNELYRCKSAYFASPFYSPGSINTLLDVIDSVSKEKEVKLLFSDMALFNRPTNFEHIIKYLPNVEIKVCEYEFSEKNFHAKAYIFDHGNDQGSVIIGSSNFTEYGFYKNIEWNYYSPYEINLAFEEYSPFVSLKNNFFECWDKSTPLTVSYIEKYKEKYELNRQKGIYHISSDKLSELVENCYTTDSQNIQPNEVQKEAIRELKILRENGAEKALVIAATGIGKTYLSAFDFRESGFSNFLFIAHRYKILEQAKTSFEKVLNKTFKNSILSSQTNYDFNNDNCFAMIQSLSNDNNLQKFDKKQFDYIIIDEFHHSAGSTYKKVLDYFKPKFILGLTATPERMDNFDIYKLCDDNIAYEIRLPEAIDRDFLVPFQYFAIKDPVDYDKIKWNGHYYDEKELEKELSDDTRTAILYNNLTKYLPSYGKIKALIFCSNIGHAKYTANELSNKYGLETVSITGLDSEEERQKAISRLRDENDSLRAICAVDVFNEGIDIPEISHVVMLRPTLSVSLYTQQLGRGLRKSPNKDYLIVLDFIGNYKKAYIAPLVLNGLTSIEYIKQHPNKKFNFDNNLPSKCFVSADIELKKIWSESLRQIFSAKKEERLKMLYFDIRNSLNEDESPRLMDFYHIVNPNIFIKHFGSWLKCKKEMDDLSAAEKNIIGTEYENFLTYLEKKLSPQKSYKMIVLKILLDIGGKSWDIDKLSEMFKNYYINDKILLKDFSLLANSKKPESVSNNEVKKCLLKNPLFYLSNTDNDYFILNKAGNTFSVKDKIDQAFIDNDMREFIEDRVEYQLRNYIENRLLVTSVKADEMLIKKGIKLPHRFTEKIFDEMEDKKDKKIKLKINGSEFDVNIDRIKDYETLQLKIPESAIEFLKNKMSSENIDANKDLYLHYQQEKLVLELNNN